MNLAQIVGWSATLLLILTLGQQAWRQWNDPRCVAVPPLLFAGQCGASILFIVYSVLVGDPVFVAANALILLTALAGLVASWRQRRLQD